MVLLREWHEQKKLAQQVEEEERKKKEKKSRLEEDGGEDGRAEEYLICGYLIISYVNIPTDLKDLGLVENSAIRK